MLVFRYVYQLQIVILCTLADAFALEQVPTNKEWREARKFSSALTLIKTTRWLFSNNILEISTRVQSAPEERLNGVKEVNGIKYAEDIILGVPVTVPV